MLPTTEPDTDEQRDLRPAGRTVRVVAPARLHLGFLDLNYGLGRRFGSLGLAIDEPTVRLTLAAASRLSVQGAQAARGEALLRRLADLFSRPPHLALTIDEAPPAHAGFGSGTQLALAVGAAFCRWHGLPFQPRELGPRLGRGGRSSLGMAAFEHGGLLLDGGLGPADRPAPLLARLPFPESWRVLLVLDRDAVGAHGAVESQAFRDIPPLSAEAAAHLCRLVLMKALPGAVEHDLDAFAGAVSEMQRILGDHFCPAQGGRFTSPRVAHALAAAEAQGIGIGQTSWGPTGFAFLPSQECAERLRAALRPGSPPGLEFMICRGRNRGAEIS